MSVNGSWKCTGMKNRTVLWSPGSELVLLPLKLAEAKRNKGRQASKRKFGARAAQEMGPRIASAKGHCTTRTT
eukprot:6060043-Pleurochrysis_carterae.AAC.2